MDTLLNEMIKHRRHYFIPSLERIFNDIIKTGTFPTEWNIGVKNLNNYTKRKVTRNAQAITEESL